MTSHDTQADFIAPVHRTPARNSGIKVRVSSSPRATSIIDDMCRCSDKIIVVDKITYDTTGL